MAAVPTRPAAIGGAVPYPSVHVTASSEAADHATLNLVDGNDQTWWSATTGDAGEWVQFDLDPPREISGLNVAVMSTTAFAATPVLTAGNFDVQVHDVSGGWQTVGSVDTPDGAVELRPHRFSAHFAPVSTGGVRILFTESPPSGGAQALSSFALLCADRAPSAPPGPSRAPTSIVSELNTWLDQPWPEPPPVEPHAGDVPAWWTERAGLDHTIPAPWTPVAANSDRLSVWGREYDFTRSPLPRTITALGDPLLAGPITFSEKSGGRGAQFAQIVRRSLTADPDEVRFSSAGRFGCSLWRARTAVEYDGMVKVDVGVRAPAQGSGPASLLLEVPLREEFATLLHSANNTGWGEISGSIPANSSWTWSPDDHRPTVWIGDETRGLEWFAETTDGWILDGTPVITVERSHGSVVLRIRLFAAPLAPGEERTFTFGLIATPTKPMPDHYQEKLYSTGYTLLPRDADRLAALGMVDVSTQLNYAKWLGTTVPSDEQAFRDDIQARADAGYKSAPYMVMTAVNYQAPPYLEYGDTWPMTTPHGAGTITVSPASSWADYVAYSIQQQMLEYGTDGTYLDLARPELDYKHGLSPSGFSAYTIFSTRELAKRVYKVAKAIKPDAEIMLHTSTSVFPAIESFATMYLDGEQFRAWPNLDERETLTGGGFRAEFLGVPFGCQGVFLPEVFSPYRDRVRGLAPINARNLYSMVVSNGAIPQDSYIGGAGTIGREELNTIIQARFDFGTWRSDTEWHPYWGQGSFALDAPPIRVSAHVRPGGSALLFVANPTADPADADVPVSAAAPGSTVALLEPPTGSTRQAGDPLPIDGNGQVHIALPAYDYAIVTVTPPVPGGD
jgi:hypothetical protein